MNNPLTLSQKAASLMLLQPLNTEDVITDEVSKLLRRIATDRDADDVIEMMTDAPDSEVVTATVLYNPFSLDSLMATTLIASCTQQFDVSTHTHHFVDTQFNVSKINVLIAAGMEINRDLLVKMMEANKDLKLILLGYRDSYEWLMKKEYVYVPKSRWSSRESGFKENIIESSEYKKYKERITLLRPSDDSFGDVIDKTDNTLTKVTQFWLRSREHQVTDDWRLMCDLVSRVYGLSFPLAGLKYEEETSCDLVMEAANRVKLHELSVKLRAALGAQKPAERIKELTLTPNVENYRAHKAVMEEMYSRSMHDTTTPALAGSSYRVRMAQMGENVVNELIALPTVARKDVVFYTDIKQFRIWRVYSPNHGRATSIVKCFKPELTWSEGMFACGVTFLTAVA